MTIGDPGDIGRELSPAGLAPGQVVVSVLEVRPGSASFAAWQKAATRETLTGTLLPQQKSAIRRVVEAEGAKRGRTEAEIARTVEASIAWATKQGFKRWTAFRAEVNGRRRMMQSMSYAEWEGHYAVPGWAHNIADRCDLPEMDWLRQYK